MSYWLPLMKFIDKEAKQRFLTNARRACEELVLLLGNVMDTSRVDQDRVSLNPGPVQVADAVKLILEILEPTISREDRPVIVRIPDELMCGLMICGCVKFYSISLATH